MVIISDPELQKIRRKRNKPQGKTTKETPISKFCAQHNYRLRIKPKKKTQPFIQRAHWRILNPRLVIYFLPLVLSEVRSCGCFLGFSLPLGKPGEDGKIELKMRLLALSYYCRRNTMGMPNGMK